MPRETFVLRDGELIPKSEARPLASASGAYVMPDITPFVTQDRVEITSRSALRAYERSRGVRQVGNDWKPPRLPGEHE
jgi:hypothetical protein